ncbi:MAG: phosphate propanoyltransferase [Patescibacteria group bacterium]|jgi:propanediol utilization protein
MHSKKEKKISNGVKTIIAEVSARHIHLNQKDLEKLFGKNFKLSKFKDLSQPEEFAAKETLVVKGGRDYFPKVRIVGPVRRKTQVELSMTDCYFLGIKPVVQLSGQVRKSSQVTLQGPHGHVVAAAIVAQRHLHISKKQAKEWKYKSGKKIAIMVKGERSAILENVVVRVGDFKTHVHLDTDEANAVGLVNKQKVYIYEK